MDDKHTISHNIPYPCTVFESRVGNPNTQDSCTGELKNKTLAGGRRHHFLFVRTILALLLLAGPALCGERTGGVYGKVVDASTKAGLPFADIFVPETKYHTSTNESGEFNIPFRKYGVSLVVSYVGYRTDSVADIQSGSPVTVRLRPVGYVTDEVKILGKDERGGMANSYELGNAEIKSFAGITRDPMRALQMMPGVSTDNVASAKMDVRGGTWDENTVLIDGAEIPDPYHLKEVSFASLSVFNADMVRSIDFSSGGFGAKYGNALSSVMDIHYKEGNRKHFEGNLNLSPLDFSASAQGPIDKNSSYIVAARGSYLGYMLKTLNVNQDLYAGYYDLQGDAAYHLSGTDKLQLDFMYSKDDAIQNPTDAFSASSVSGTVNGTSTNVSRTMNNVQSFTGHYSSLFLSAFYNSTPAPSLALKTLVYFTGNHGNSDPVNDTRLNVKYSALPNLWSSLHAIQNAGYILDANTALLSESAIYHASPILEFDAGLGGRRINYKYDPHMGVTGFSESNVLSYPDTTITPNVGQVKYLDTTKINTGAFAASGYIQSRADLPDGLTLTAGARLDYFNLDREARVSPRLNFSWLAPLGVTISGGAGVYYQLPSYNQLKSSSPSDTNTPFEKATQFILGFERKLGSAANLQVQFYRKYYSDLVPAIRNAYTGLYYNPAIDNGIGYAKGFDIRYEMHSGRFSLFIGYGYLVAMEKSGASQNYYPRTSDQRHTLSVELEYSPWKSLALDLRGVYGSGYPYTPSVSVLDPGTMSETWKQGPENSARYPAYERVDLRVTRKFTLYHNPLSVYLDITNLLNRKNVWGYMYTYDARGDYIAEPQTLMGIVPAVGVSYSFGGTSGEK